ncbi:MAG: hypothetical protein WC728_18180 [Elusimicrobiota bacterium]
MFRKPSGTQSGALLGRLKNLRSRDLAFIAAGLSMFVMAPIAEHFISKSGGEEPLQAGFDQKGSFFGAGAPFEDGVGGVAPGGLVGGESDLVTPLNVRHPADLITNEEDAAPPEAPALVAQSESPAPRKQVEGGWKDAISDAAKRGVSKASARVKLPMPGAKLANKLNGISTFGGGGGHTSAAMPALSALSSKGLTSVPHTGTNLSRVEPVSGYRGSGKRGNTGTGGAFSRQADGRLSGPAGSSGSGSGEGYLRNSPVTASGPGFGSRDMDSPGSASGANSAKDDRNIGIKDKESLAELRKKMEMQEAIKLKWAKKQYNQIERKKMMEQTAMQTASQAALKVLEKALQLNEDEEGGSGSGSSGSGGGGQHNPGQAPETIGGGSSDNMQALSDQFGKGAGGTKDFPAYSAEQLKLQKDYLASSNRETSGKKALGEAGDSQDQQQQKIDGLKSKLQTMKTENTGKDGEVKKVEAMPSATDADRQKKIEAANAIPELPKEEPPEVTDALEKQAEEKYKEADKKREELEKNEPQTGTFVGLARDVDRLTKANGAVNRKARELAARGAELYKNALKDLDAGVAQKTRRNQDLGTNRQQVNGDRTKTLQERQDINTRLLGLKLGSF